MVAYYGEKEGVKLYRKHMKQYLEPFGFAQGLLPEMLAAKTQAELERLLVESGERAEVGG
jgi:hypothetical protein